jgi:hypothetical protein
MAELNAVFMQYKQMKVADTEGHAIIVSVRPNGGDAGRDLQKTFWSDSIEETLLQVSKGLTDLLRGEIPSAAAEQEQQKLVVLNAEEGKGE